MNNCSLNISNKYYIDVFHRSAIENVSIEVNMLYLEFGIFTINEYANTSIPNLKKLRN